MIESAIGAYQINRIMTPIVSLMNDVTGMIVFLSLVASVLGFTFLTGMLGADPKMSDVIDAFTTQREQAIAAGIIVASPLGFGLGSQISKWLGLFPEK